MDKIIKKISEIEAAASDLMERANQEKKIFAEKMEDRTCSFDEELHARTEKELLQLRKKLEEDLNSRLAALKADAGETLQRMESNYETHHQDYVRNLFLELTRE